MIDIISILVAGIFSCIILDILGYLLKLMGIPEPSWGIVGRWTYYMLKNATFFNPNIAHMPNFRYEVLLGWIFHYYVSICWAVIGMIGAFDAIAEAGDVSPSLVAGGIKIALLTTVGGLIVAVILQLFYNYLVSKIDSLVNNMEDASISLVDILVKNKLSK